MPKVLKILIFILAISIALNLIVKRYFPVKNIPKSNPVSTPSPTPDPPFTTYVAPQIKPAPYYVIAYLGDSMTHALGPHGGKATEYLQKNYRDKGLIVSNYANPSTNILSVPERLNQPTTVWGETFPPLLTWKFDILIIESFGYNPLSQFPLEEGLKKQREMLDQIMKTFIRQKPEVLIIFLSTIAPSKTNYAKKVLNLSPEDRLTQVNERIAYIQNHMAYAREHNIPLIDVFDKSLDSKGEADLSYINPDDNIHPSFAGIELISHEIADFITSNHYFPDNK